MSLYLILNLLTIAAPLLLSFDKKVHFYTYWKGIFAGLFVMMLLFIPWDVLFTRWGVWGFNQDYLTGIDIINLPLEEWLFFITVPYACAFIHEVFKAWFPQLDPFKNQARTITMALAVTQFILGFVFYQNAYTFSAFILNAVFLSFLWMKKVKWLSRFLLTYTIVLIPFLSVNGILTGGFTDEPVVWYNNNENLGIRVFTIPVEDFMYNMLMLGMVIGIHEFLKKRTSQKRPN